MSIRTVEYVFEEPVCGIAEAHFKFGTVTLRGVGERSKLLRIYQGRFHELAGGDPAKMDAAQREMIDPSLTTQYNLWTEWAHIAVSLRSIRGRLEGSAEFMDLDLADLEWDTLAGLETMPGDLFDAMNRAAVLCNPRIFGRVIQDEEKQADPTVGVIRIS